MTLQSHDAAARAFVDAAESGRLHHAWLLSGPKGIGKALFARRAAEYMLSMGERSGSLGFDADPLAGLNAAAESGAARQVEAGSHPDFREIVPDESKASAQISVDQIRALSGLFATTAGMGGWRVAIIDAAEDMNRNAANAILKLLEEPPRDSLFFLISHAPGRLLPTIRSRCRTLKCHLPPRQGALEILSAHVEDMEPQELEAVLDLAGGSPGEALALIEANAPDYLGAITEIFGSLPKLNAQAASGLAEQMGTRASGGPFEACVSLLDYFIGQAVRAGAVSYDAAPPWTRLLGVSDWLGLHDRLQELRGQTMGLNLNPRHVILSYFHEVAALCERRN